MHISNLKTEDIPAVLQTSEECGLCLWTADAYHAELVRDDSIMLKLGSDDGRLAGFAVGRIFDFGEGLQTAELTNIGVRHAFRNQGFGQLLLKSFLNNCKTAKVRRIMLEVRISNAGAIRFYEFFGFVTSGRRKGFYTHPTEDALTMQLVLSTESRLGIST